MKTRRNRRGHHNIPADPERQALEEKRLRAQWHAEIDAPLGRGIDPRVGRRVPPHPNLDSYDERRKR